MILNLFFINYILKQTQLCCFKFCFKLLNKVVQVLQFSVLLSAQVLLLSVQVLVLVKSVVALLKVSPVNRKLLVQSKLLC